MADTYRELMLQIAPPWLATEHAAPFILGMGDVKDSLLWRMREAVKIRFPTYATNDAITMMGGERGIVRGANETRESYAARVREAWDSWESAGTAEALLKQLAGAGYAAVIPITNGRIYSLDGDGALVIETLPIDSWWVDPDPDLWAFFDVIIVAPFPWGADPTPADGSDEAELVKRIVRKWKPSHMTCTKIVVYESGLLWGYPTGILWGDVSYVWGDTASTLWTP